jgi:hypothetical protein
MKLGKVKWPNTSGTYRSFLLESQMNRESVNTILLILCLAITSYTAFLVTQRPATQDLEKRIDAILAARLIANREFDNARLQRNLREVLANQEAGKSGEVSGDSGSNTSNDTHDSPSEIEPPGANTDPDAPGN